MQQNPEKKAKIFSSSNLNKYGTEFYVWGGSAALAVLFSIGVTNLSSLAMTELTKKPLPLEINPISTAVIENLQDQAKFKVVDSSTIKNQSTSDKDQLPQSNTQNLSSPERAENFTNSTKESKPINKNSKSAKIVEVDLVESRIEETKSIYEDQTLKSKPTQKLGDIYTNAEEAEIPTTTKPVTTIEQQGIYAEDIPDTEMVEVAACAADGSGRKVYAKA